MTITLDLPAELEGPLKQAARTQGKDVPAFLLDSVRQRLRPDVLLDAEAKLLQVINAPIAPEARRQRDTFLAEQSRRDLTEAERTTLTHRIDVVELANAERWRCIAELARLRGLSLAEIAAQLEIPLT